MKTRNHRWLLLPLLFIALNVGAQAIVWQLRPADYDHIEPFGAGLYQVSRNGHIGLIRADGTTVVPVEYDGVTKFHEHKALVLRTEAGQSRIGGYLTDKGDFVPFSKKYYTLTGQAFYSDGMLSVANEQKRVGYLDESGAEAVGFDGKYDRIKPFTEGYAAVFKNKRYSLIDKQGQSMHFNIGLGEVYGGTNVFKGKAVIWDTDGNFYSYDTSSRKCDKSKSFSEAAFDYLYCFTALSGRTRDVPFATLSVSGRQGLSPKQGSNGLFGYTSDGREILPCQFTEATPFVDDVAVVTLQGKRGMLRWVADSKPFALAVAKPTVSYVPGETVTCGFQLTVPEAWAGKALDVKVTDAASNADINTTVSGGEYAFSLKPATDSKSVHVAVRSEGLDLWHGEATYTFKRIELRVSVSVNGEIANKDDQIPVTATITNPGDVEVTATVNMTGSKTFVEKHTTVTIPAGRSVQVHSYFLVKQDVSGQSVHVTTSKGGSASKTNLRFESYN